MLTFALPPHPTPNTPPQYAVPGGLIGVGTQMDPTLTRADRLVGQVLGHAGTLPEVFGEIEVRAVAASVRLLPPAGVAPGCWPVTCTA